VSEDGLVESVSSSTGKEFVFAINGNESTVPFLQASSEILDRYDGPLGCVLDVGAHIGTFTVLAAERGAEFIVSLEPDPNNYRLLTENVVANGYRDKVLALPLAATTKTFDQVTLYRATGGGNSGQSSLMIPWSLDPASQYRVRTIALQDLLRMAIAAKGKVDLFKLDIEGGEWPIFTTLGKEGLLLFKDVGYVDLELHGVYKDRFKEQAESIYGLFKALGFTGSLQTFGDDCARYYGRRT
jgi:FkbM family methyltransferase